MPRHYLPDSIVNRVQDGKMMEDTVWHTVANIRLQNQLGDTVNLYDVQNKIIVADFFFTSCAGICPRLTKNMVQLQRSFAKGGDQFHHIDTSIVQFVSERKVARTEMINQKAKEVNSHKKTFHKDIFW